jgi:hypothetical protein
MKHEVVECPVELTKSIHFYMDIMGLNFAAFDFALDYEGRWIFLECNPNGQWLWLEVLTGLPLVETIARHLALVDRCPARRGQFQSNWRHRKNPTQGIPGEPLRVSIGDGLLSGAAGIKFRGAIPPARQF